MGKVWLTFYDMLDWVIEPDTDGKRPDRASIPFDSRVEALEYVAANYRCNRRSISAQLKRIGGMIRRERAKSIESSQLISREAQSLTTPEDTGL